MATRKQKILVIAVVFISIISIGAFIASITSKPTPSSFLSNIATATLPQSLVTVDSTGNLAASIVVSELIKTLIPTGSIMPFCGDVAPSGFLICDGAVISPTTYPELSLLLGSKFGSANQLPDLRGRVVAGVASSGIFSGVGTKLGASSNIVPLPAHAHSIYSAGGGVNVSDPNLYKITIPSYGTRTKNVCASDGCSNGLWGTLEPSDMEFAKNTGVSGISNVDIGVVQPTLCLNYIIKT